MLNSQCKRCPSKVECSIRFVNAKYGDSIFCTDGSQLIVDENYDKNVVIGKGFYKQPKIALKVHYCERCSKHGKQQLMKIIQLPEKEKEQKMEQFKFNKMQHYLVLHFYEFVECPICNWYKFVKTRRN